MEDIKPFLTDGSMLGIKANDAVAKLHKSISKDLIEEVKTKDTTIHRYKTTESDIEFYSAHNVIIGVIIKFWNNEQYYFGNGYPPINASTSLYEFLSMIETLNITWKIATNDTHGSTLCIKLASNIYCFFELERQELVKIGTGNKRIE